MIWLVTLYAFFITLLPYQIMGLTFSIILTLKTKSTSKLIWIAFFSGLLFDLFCSDTWIGTFALISLLSALLVKRIEHFLFSDTLLTFALFSFCFSIAFSTLSLIALYLIGNPLSFSPPFLITELIIPSLLDTAFSTTSYAILLAFQFTIKRVKRWTQPT